MMSAVEQSPAPGRFQHHTVALWLLIGAHLPFFVIEFCRQWQREHYQFFPFAFAAFAWLLNSRRFPGAFRWGHFNTLLVVGDLVCLTAGVIFNSPLLVCFGLLLTLFAICRSLYDMQVEGSLAYLILLPAITLRPPQNYDMELIHWLQRATTRVASELLNFFGVLHLRTGNVLEFPGKRFLVEEACSGVQSLFTLLFLATFIVCIHRRKLLHSVAVLSCAVCLAGVLNVMRVCTVAVAWDRFGVDLSAGLPHEAVGYCALIIAALLVLSADAMAEFLTDYIPDQAGVGVQAIFRNPFITLWNRLFIRMPRNLEQVNAELPESVSCGSAVSGSVALVSLSFLVLQLMKL